MLIPARMRVGASWSDACILNISSRGMLIRSGSAPLRGNYLEVCRGRHVVIARVVWSRDQSFGVQAQDPVCADALVQERDNSSNRGFGSASDDRRSARRPAAVRHESSRQRGRALEFGSLTVFGIAAAFLLFATVNELLGRPLGALEAALVSRTEQQR